MLNVIQIKESEIRKLNLSYLENAKKIYKDKNYRWEPKRFYLNSLIDENKDFWLNECNNITRTLMVAFHKKDNDFEQSSFRIKYYNDVASEIVFYPNYTEHFKKKKSFVFVCSQEAIEIPKNEIEVVYIIKFDE